MIRTSWPSGDAASDLDAAVAAGILDRDTSLKLAAFLQSRGTVPEVPLNADDEQLRLITGFNDIFVTIGIGLFLGLWPFSLAMIALDLLFVRDRSWVAVGRWASHAGGVLRQLLPERQRTERPVTTSAGSPS